jgi:glyoxylase-like metal-dependent hydrolase (beta-lactamase superfamily II)
MKHVFLYGSLMLATLALPAVALAQGTSPIETVDQAVDAIGGMEALRAAKSLMFSADAQFWEPQQSYVADGEPRFIGNSKITFTWKNDDNASRTDWEREFEYPFAEEKKYSEIVTSKYGAVSTEGSAIPMSNIRFASYRRELERTLPNLLLKALDEPQRLSSLPSQTLGGKSLPSVALTDGDFKFAILFDPSTKLPAAIRSFDDDWIYGDITYDLAFADWRQVDGIKFPFSQTYKVNDIKVGHLDVKEVTVNPIIPAETFAIRDEGRKEAEKPAPGSVPYQWVIRRLFLGRFLDSDAVNFPASATGLRLVELSPNVQFATGGSHNSLIVSRKDYLVVIDAPINEWQSRWTIDAAKAKYPGKPIKYLVLTHHHNDHTGGARTYVAEGATIVVAAPNKKHFEAVFRLPHKLVPDELQRHPKPADIIEFADHMTLKDDSGDIELYKIANPHADGMLIAHLVRENLVWVTDLYSPLRDKDRSAMLVSFDEALKQRGIAPTRIVGGHGGVAPLSEMEAVLAGK